MYKEQYETNYKYYRFIIYWGQLYRSARGLAIFGELSVRMVRDSRWFKVMISLLFILAHYNITDNY